MSWRPSAEAWQQLVAVHQFVGRHVRIQFWDDGTMWLLAPDEWPHPVLGFCEGTMTLRKDGHLQAYLLLRGANDPETAGCSGMSFLDHWGRYPGMLAPLASIYEITTIPQPKQGRRPRPQ